MDYRKITIFNGVVFDVPKHIVRIDIMGLKTTHGWQVRYGKPWKLFSDYTSDGSGAKLALSKAIDELNMRIATLPAPTGIKRQISHKKLSGLPAGISGPVRRVRKGRRTACYHFQVTLPIHGEKSKNAQIYIGSENTLTEERIQQAVTKSIELRQQYISRYQRSATQSKRKNLVVQIG